MAAAFSWLPEVFKSVVIKHESVDNGFFATVRSSAKSMEELGQWLQEFEDKTKTQWVVRRTFPGVSRLACRIDYVCQHSNFNKSKSTTQRDSKKCGCGASVTLKIKLVTKKTKTTDQLVKQGLPSIIEIKNLHNHSTETAKALLHLTARAECQETFISYFNNGMGVAEAMKYHASLLELQGDINESLLADGSVNPKQRTVSHWHDEWRELNFGTRTGSTMLKVLEEKLELYRSRGHLVALHSDPMVIVIVTAIMQRAHSLHESSKIVFVDSTASCDSENHSITFIMTPCAAGAVPLGVCITDGQSADDYKLAFRLFQTVVEPFSFGRQGHPLTFITDDSDAERAGLLEIWPQSSTKLCLFHVQQSVWRWLWEVKHSVERDDRRELMMNFQELVRCTDMERVSFVHDRYIVSDVWRKNPQWQNYMQGYWNRRELWCMAWRDNSMMGHNTNNFCESTIRLFKDLVLGRCKAYNVVTLVDFTCTVMEDYYRHRLLEFSHGRNHKPQRFFASILRKSAYLDLATIVTLDPDTFSVPSEHEEHISYEVNHRLGTCTCPYAKSGQFCKHQAGIWKLKGIPLATFPPISAEARYQMAVIALGDQAGPVTFYSDFAEPLASHEPHESGTEITATSITKPCNEVHDIEDTTEKSKTNMTTGSTDDGSQALKIFLQTVEDLHHQFKTAPTDYDKILKRLGNIRTETQWKTFLNTQGGGVSCLYRSGSAIRVQPTSLSRRRASVTRGSKRIAAGRPPLSAAANLRRKRARALSMNIGKNQPNAKSHGQCH